MGNGHMGGRGSIATGDAAPDPTKTNMQQDKRPAKRTIWYPDATAEKKSLQSLAAISCICQVNHIKDYRLTWRTGLTKRAKKNISNAIIIKGMRCQMNAANAFIYSGDLGLYCCLLKMMSKEAWTVYRNMQKIPELYLNRNFLFYKIMSLFISTST